MGKKFYRVKFIPIFLVSIILLCLFGCASTPSDDVVMTANYWLEYLPYPSMEMTSRCGIRPTPYFLTWSDQRMTSDLKRIADLPRIRSILVRLTVNEILDNAIWERLSTFCRLAEKFKMHIALYLTTEPGGKSIRLQHDNLIAWLEQQNYDAFPGLFRLDSRPIVILDKSIAISERKPTTIQDSIDILQLGRDLPVHPTGRDASFLPRINAISWVRAGDRGQARNYDNQTRDWLISRKGGELFRRQLVHSQTMGMDIIIISSWNNYDEGSFIAPNSFDGSVMLKQL